MTTRTKRKKASKSTPEDMPDTTGGHIYGFEKNTSALTPILQLTPCIRAQGASDKKYLTTPSADSQSEMIQQIDGQNLPPMHSPPTSLPASHKRRHVRPPSPLNGVVAPDSVPEVIDDVSLSLPRPYNTRSGNRERHPAVDIGIHWEEAKRE